MSKYVVQVGMTYVHIVDVEADDKEGECHVIEIDGEKV